MANIAKKPTPITVGDFVLDASITESHSFASEVTQFPVEQGSAISDNVRPKPIVVSIEGIVSDTPIGRIADLRSQSGSDSVPSTDALSALLAIRDARQPVTIATSLSRFENMVMTNLEIPRDASTGAALRFTATFQQITIVTNQRTTVRTIEKRTASPSGKPKKNLGKWAAKTGNPGVYVQSWAIELRPTATKIFGPPVLSTPSMDLDHYKVDDNGKYKPDGYVGSDNRYHPITPIDAVHIGIATQTSGMKVDGKPVKYDPQSGWLVDQSGKQVPVTKAPPKQLTQADWTSQMISGKPPGL